MDDIVENDILYAVLVRSPSAKGVIEAFEHPEIPPHIHVIQSRDIPGENLLYGSEMPLLSCESVYYIGEPIAVITAPSEREAAAFAKKCTARIQEDTPAFSIETFTNDNVFEIFRGGGNMDSETGESAGDTSAENETTGKESISVGNTYQTGTQYQWSYETCGAIAHYKDNLITVYTAADDANKIQNAVSRVLAKPPEEIRVNLLPVGISFDAKSVYPAVFACYAALAAAITKRNVRILLTRDEDYLYSPKRCRARFGINSLVDKYGHVQKTNIDVRYDYGAWNIWKCAGEAVYAGQSGSGRGSRSDGAALGRGAGEADSALKDGFAAMLNVYNLGELNACGIAVRTNLPPSGPFCGGGASQAVFALENHVNSITDRLGIDGIEWRKNNFTKDAALLSDDNRAILASILDRAGILSDYKRKRSAYKALMEEDCSQKERIVSRRGIGLAAAFLWRKADAGAADVQGRLPFGAAIPLHTAAVIETEIDKITYTPYMRSILLVIAVPEFDRKNYPAHGIHSNIKHIRRLAARAVRQGFFAAYGWAAAEKMEYVNGGITPEKSSDYGILSVSAAPSVRIEFVEHGSLNNIYAAYTHSAQTESGRQSFLLSGALQKTLRHAPFHVIPSAYLQAVSQAVGHVFVKIPISPVNIWNFLRSQENKE
ncbi:MAG: xanthine dehydrogenase family protein molybdopterin-binding subunit [Spirochaetaceae bacterium]|nr:xanthine dehydrogenase family protein molybdopterin-binding subunit [Spirochaetaceae bacterium]